MVSCSFIYWNISIYLNNDKKPQDCNSYLNELMHHFHYSKIHYASSINKLCLYFFLHFTSLHTFKYIKYFIIKVYKENKLDCSVLLIVVVLTIYLSLSKTKTSIAIHWDPGPPFLSRKFFAKLNFITNEFTIIQNTTDRLIWSNHQTNGILYLFWFLCK